MEELLAGPALPQQPLRWGLVAALQGLRRTPRPRARRTEGGTLSPWSVNLPLDSPPASTPGSMGLAHTPPPAVCRGPHVLLDLPPWLWGHPPQPSPLQPALSFLAAHSLWGCPSSPRPLPLTPCPLCPQAHRHLPHGAAEGGGGEPRGGDRHAHRRQQRYHQGGWPWRAPGLAHWGVPRGPVHLHPPHRDWLQWRGGILMDGE